MLLLSDNNLNTWFSVLIEIPSYRWEIFTNLKKIILKRIFCMYPKVAVTCNLKQLWCLTFNIMVKNHKRKNVKQSNHKCAHILMRSLWSYHTLVFGNRCIFSVFKNYIFLKDIKTGIRQFILDFMFICDKLFICYNAVKCWRTKYNWQISADSSTLRYHNCI